MTMGQRQIWDHGKHLKKWRLGWFHGVMPWRRWSSSIQAWSSSRVRFCHFAAGSGLGSWRLSGGAGKSGSSARSSDVDEGAVLGFMRAGHAVKRTGVKNKSTQRGRAATKRHSTQRTESTGGEFPRLRWEKVASQPIARQLVFLVATNMLVLILRFTGALALFVSA